MRTTDNRNMHEREHCLESQVHALRQRNRELEQTIEILRKERLHLEQTIETITKAANTSFFTLVTAALFPCRIKLLSFSALMNKLFLSRFNLTIKKISHLVAKCQKEISIILGTSR